MDNKQKTGIFVMLISLVFLLGACEKKTEKQSGYYNIDSLVRSQISLLSSMHTTLTREIRLGNKTVMKVLSYKDTTGWITELDEFRQLKVINKPTYSGAFRVEDGLNDPRSNLRVKAFLNTQDLPIKYFKLYYQETPYKIRKIETLYRDQNSLYKSFRTLTMEFHDVYNKTVLRSYSIKGGQKMILGDSIDFNVEGKVQID